MIPNFSTYLKESVWGDLRKKSLGQEDRIEKDVNLMDFKELHDYILDHYDYPDEAYVTFKEPEEGKFGIEAYIMNLENSPDQDFYIEYTTEYTEYSKGKPAVVIPDNIPQYLPGIYKKMDAKYDLEEFTNETIFGMSYHISIKPKTGEVNNRFFLELLDFLSDNTTSYIKKK